MKGPKSYKHYAVLLAETSFLLQVFPGWRWYPCDGQSCRVYVHLSFNQSFLLVYLKLHVVIRGLGKKPLYPLPSYCLWCSLGYGIPGVHAVYDTEPVHGLDSEPQREVSDQTFAVGADSSLHSRCCKRSHHSGMLDQQQRLSVVSIFFLL